MQSAERIGYSFPPGTTVILRNCQGAYYLPPGWAEGTRATVVAVHGQEYEVEAKGRTCRVSQYCLHSAPVESPPKQSAPAPRRVPAPLKKPEWLIYGEEIRKQLAEMPAKKSTPHKSQELLHSTYGKAKEVHGYEGTIADWAYLVRYIRGER